MKTSASSIPLPEYRCHFWKEQPTVAQPGPILHSSIREAFFFISCILPIAAADMPLRETEFMKQRIWEIPGKRFIGDPSLLIRSMLSGIGFLHSAAHR